MKSIQPPFDETKGKETAKKLNRYIPFIGYVQILLFLSLEQEYVAIRKPNGTTENIGEAGQSSFKC